MQQFLKALSFIFHPLIIPLLGVSFYFAKTPRYFPEEIIKAKLISIFILTVILPILLYFLLKTLGKVNTIYLKSTKERILPLLINSFIIFLVIRRVVPAIQILELYYFFLALLCSLIACLMLAVFKVKASLHMVGISSLFMFFIALSIHFSININGALILIAILTGALATSRLLLNAHNDKELVIGLFAGLFPQLIMLNYWL